MAEKLQIQLKEVGSKLENPPANKDALIKLLKQAAASLSELDQSPPKAVLECMQPFLNAIVKPELLKHQDKEVKLLVATCTCEITRITAPEAPYDDDVLKDIFHLIVSTFSGLRDTKGPSFGRRVIILDTVAKYRSCVVMLDLGCDDLVDDMFRTFFAVASDEHSETVITSMKTIMAVLLEESEDIREELLLIILSVLGRDKKDITAAARRLAMNVIGQCAGKLESAIKQFIVSSMSGDSTALNHQIDYHEVIYDVYRCAPQALSGIVPYLTGELLTDKTDLRLKAVRLVGDLFALSGSTISETFQPIFVEFLKRLTDRVVEVRMLVLEHVRLCLLSDPFRAEAPQLVAALCDRLLDYDESIRKQVVTVVSDIACQELSSISAETVKLVAERLRDKSLLVKKYTMERLSDIYRICCSKHSAGLNLSDDYDWIPGRILRCFYDKDFRSDTVEYILCTSLFPSEFSVRDKVRNWVRLFSKLDKVEVKALEKMLEQKQRLQLELQKYLSLRQMYKDIEAPESQKKVTVCFRVMSHCFVDPTKAETDFQLLHQLKDANVWKILTTLLDPNTSSLQSWSLRDELLKIVGEKHPLYGILGTLSMKISYILFDKEYVKDFLVEADLQRSAGNRLLTQSCMNMLVILACFSPLLLSGIGKDLLPLLEDDNEVIKEGVLHVLAKAGGTIREQLGESSSTLDLILERICLEGSRRQAKYAVHALAAITKDDGLKSLSVLYKRLVDMLEKKTHLPSVLQSLGCIAQTAMPVFETQENKIKDFIRKEILGCSQKTGDKAKESWDGRSNLCSLKVFGIKTLVKSFLPVKDAHLRLGVDELISALRNILSFGEISKDIESSSVDKAHLKLASAKAILRLSKHWDKTIPVDVFYLTLRTSEVGFPEVKKIFLNKVHQYIKDRSLDPKFACAFLLDLGSQQSDLEEENQNLSDIIQMCQQGKARQLSMQSDGNFSVVHPEHILPYLVHALAHHPSFPNIDECKDAKTYEPIYRKLNMFLSMLTHGGEDGKSNVGLKKEDTILILSIIRSIKRSQDAVDTNMSKNLYAVCDLCLSLTRRLAQKQEDLQDSILYVSLPDELYKPHENNKKNHKEEYKKEENKEEDTEEKNREGMNKEAEMQEAKNKEEGTEEKNKEAEMQEANNKEEETEEKNTEEETEEKNKEAEMQEANKTEEETEEKNKEAEMPEEKNKEEEIEEKNKEEETDEKNKEEEKEEVDEVTEGRTWLADESALAYFESLNLESNESVPSKLNEDILKDSETDGNEVPLGTMLKRLKLKGAKARKVAENKSTAAAVENVNNVDILGVLRDINLENSGALTKFETSNGHGKLRTDEKKHKRKSMHTESTNVSVPKRRRSSSAKTHKRLSFPTSGLKGASIFDNIKQDDVPHNLTEDKGALDEPTEPTDLDGRRGDRGHLPIGEQGNRDDSDLEKPKTFVETESNQKSRSLKKRKRRRVSGLVKCTATEGEIHTTDLIGSRIKVWWPMDEAFYEGVVKSYDHEKKKHVVLYNDGDIEVLRLDRELWEIVDNDHKPTKRKRLSKSPRPKGGSSKKKVKSLDSTVKNKELEVSPSKVRGKRTPRKNLKRGQKGVFQRTPAHLEVERREDSDMSEPNSKSELATFSKVENLDTESSDREKRSSAGEEDSDMVEKSSSKVKQTNNAVSSSRDTESHKEDKPDSGEKETENVESISQDGPESGENGRFHIKENQLLSSARENSAMEEDEVNKSDSGGNQESDADSQSTESDRQKPAPDEAEFSDDEPLGVWKSRVGGK